LAVIGGGSALISWLAGGGASWLVVALLLFGIVGFTLVSIRPVYNALLAPSLRAESPAARELLVRWGRLHNVRSALGLLAFLMALRSL
jgi:hypothetical protein